MDREEAIKILQKEIDEDIFTPTEYRKRIHEALDMAIEALQAKTDGDLISRQDAIRWVKTECNPFGKPTLDFESGKRVIEHLEQMPSAETPTLNEKHQLSAETPTTDLISRADAIEAVAQQWLFEASAESPYVNDDDIGDYRKLASELLSDIPSADRPSGEWVIRENGNKECSLCGHERQDGWDYFCGYCGARMKGGDSE